MRIPAQALGLQHYTFCLLCGGKWLSLLMLHACHPKQPSPHSWALYETPVLLADVTASSSLHSCSLPEPTPSLYAESLIAFRASTNRILEGRGQLLRLSLGVLPWKNFLEKLNKKVVSCVLLLLDSEVS